MQKLTFDPNGARIEAPGTRRHDMRVILRNNGNNRHTSPDSKVESTLLERQQHSLIGVTPGTLGEDEDALLVGLHLIHSTIEGLHSSFAVRPVNKDSARQPHEPTKEGYIAERLLGRDTAVGGEDIAKHEDVQLSLVVTNKDGRAGGEMLLTLDDIKADSGGEAHHPLEAAGGGPLGDSAVACNAEDDGRGNSIGCAKKERAICGETAGEKCCTGHLLAKGEE